MDWTIRGSIYSVFGIKLRFDEITVRVIFKKIFCPQIVQSANRLTVSRFVGRPSGELLKSCELAVSVCLISAFFV